MQEKYHYFGTVGGFGEVHEGGSINKEFQELTEAKTVTNESILFLTKRCKKRRKLGLC